MMDNFKILAKALLWGMKHKAPINIDNQICNYPVFAMTWVSQKLNFVAIPTTDEKTKKLVQGTAIKTTPPPPKKKYLCREILS